MHRSNITARRAVIAAVSAGVLFWASCRQNKAASGPGVSVPAATSVGPVPVIVAPATGTVVAPGESVRVVVQASSTRVMLVGPETSLTDDAAPFEFDLLIPAGAVGSFPIQAFGASDTGTFAESNTVTLSVRGPRLQSMQMVPREMMILAPGSTQSLSVLGTYSDGVTRDITEPSAGTTYIARGEGVVSVSPAGVVTALSLGVGSVIAWNQPHNASVTVHVMPSASP